MGGRSSRELEKILKKGIKARFPQQLSPMLATLAELPQKDDDWTYEVKWDGYRALAFITSNGVELRSRNDKSFNEKFYPIVSALQNWSHEGVLDGELVVVDENGMADFGALQNWRSEADGALIYYVFDLLWLDGYDLSELPLAERRVLLSKCLPRREDIRYSEPLEATGKEAFDLVSKIGLEGLIAKRSQSIYQAGARSKDWLKVKTENRQEVVIGGYTRNEGTSKLFSSLLVGVYDGKKLVYTGKVGTGFNVKMQRQLLSQFKSLETDTCPFYNPPDINQASRFRPNPPTAVATWLEPKLVCEVNYRELTSDGVMRHPSFQGMRADKNPETIMLETKPATKPAANRLTKPQTRKERKTLLNPSEETQVKRINGNELKFTNLSKLFWPEEGVAKRDMINYYYQVAPYILPYLKDRPLTLNRHPNGIKGKSFYQKDVKGKAPSWIETMPYFSEADDREKEFLVCTNEASLLYVAALGCIEMNPWSSRRQSPDHPDWCIIDLDPDGNPFEEVIETAQVTHRILEALKLPSVCKTSGSTGLHIYIPLGAKYTYEDSKEFGRKLVKLVHAELPEFTSIERLTSKRKGKVYLDFLQNRPQATVAGVYSLRPKPGATVSMPLFWEEVKKGLKMKDFTIFNAVSRIRETGDLFKPVLGKGIDLKKAEARLSEF